MKMTFVFALLLLTNISKAYEAKVTKGKLPATLEAMIEKANQDTKLNFTIDDFYLVEEKNLATSHFKMFVQKAEGGVPVSKTAVRIWSDKQTKGLILAQLHLDEEAKREEDKLSQKFHRARFTKSALKSKLLNNLITTAVEKEVSTHETDSRILGMKFKDVWSGGDLIREVEIRGRRGLHFISISLLKNKVLSKRYVEFPQSEGITYQSMRANVFPMYEEVETTGQRLSFEQKELKYIRAKIPDGGERPLGDLESATFSEELYNPILAETQVGQENGFWSEASLRRKVAASVANLPIVPNDLTSGVLLQGKYVTINIHPGAKALGDLDLVLSPSVNHIINWVNTNGFWEAKPVSSFYGKRILSKEELLNLIPERHPDHDPVTYINSGFDEVQVYYGVTVLMDALAEMGFEDEKLSTDPFHAFLFDPDIGMKDNAYYYDNTINFTTYNPGSPNLARDNPTIWHELGHGVMDRLMGPHLGFAGTAGGYGGLSEGMADFLAMIVVEHQTDGANFPGKQDFRIINNTGFYLTNEYHDEGEAYGGVMGDMLSAAIAREGREGLFDFTDLTLEAMRLTRNHPALSPQAWFEHMLYADELGSEVREQGQYKKIILDALTKRNFAFSNAFKPAAMKITFGETELSSSSQGSRDNPLKPCATNGEISYDLNISLSSGDAQFIKFPATVKVEFKKGALQGAIRWAQEESNPLVYTVNSAEDLLTINLKAAPKCESINQPNEYCKDYAYLQVFNAGGSKPVAKKRFYLMIKDGLECNQPE